MSLGINGTAELVTTHTRRNLCVGSYPLAFLAMLLMFLATPVQAQVTGDWTITYSQMGRQGGAAREVSMDITLKQDGATVTGTTMMAMGGRGGAAGGTPPAPQEVAISDGKMEGDKLTFTINRGMGERTISMVFTGTVAGNAMEGTMAMCGRHGRHGRWGADSLQGREEVVPTGSAGQAGSSAGLPQLQTARGFGAPGRFSFPFLGSLQNSRLLRPPSVDAGRGSLQKGCLP